MTEPEDNRIIDLLYGDLSDDEMNEARASLDTENEEALESLGGVLEVLRSVEDEEPPPHLDALILARAREEAGAASEEALPWWKKLMRGPGLGVAMAGAAAVVLGVIVVPNMSSRDEPAPILEVVGEATLAEEMPAAAPAAPAHPGAVSAGETTAEVDKFEAARKQDGVEGDGRAGAPRQAAPTELAEPEAELGRTSGKKERRDHAKTGRRAAPEPTPSRIAKPQARASAAPKKKSAPAFAADPKPDPNAMMREEKKGALADDSAGRGGGGSAIGGLGSGAAGEDRRLKDEDDEARPADQPASDGLVQLQGAGPSGTATRDSEVEAPAAAPPVSTKRARRKAKSAASSPPPPAPKAPVDLDSTLPSEVRRTIDQSRTLRKKGQVDAARTLLVRTRRRFVRTPSYAVLSQELAELEFEAKRYTQASAYARDAMTSKNPNVVRRARRTFQKSEAAR